MWEIGQPPAANPAVGAVREQQQAGKQRYWPPTLWHHSCTGVRRPDEEILSQPDRAPYRVPRAHAGCCRRRAYRAGLCAGQHPGEYELQFTLPATEDALPFNTIDQLLL